MAIRLRSTFLSSQSTNDSNDPWTPLDSFLVSAFNDDGMVVGSSLIEEYLQRKQTSWIGGDLISPVDDSSWPNIHRSNDSTPLPFSTEDDLWEYKSSYPVTKSTDHAVIVAGPSNEPMAKVTFDDIKHDWNEDNVRQLLLDSSHPVAKVEIFCSVRNDYACL